MSAEHVNEWQSGEQPFPSLRINNVVRIDLVGMDDDSLIGAAAGRPNLAQICLVVDDTEFTSLTSDLEQAGVAIEQGPVIRSGARGDAISIYVRDPDRNLVEVRTYARRPLLRIAMEDARRRVRDAI